MNSDDKNKIEIDIYGQRYRLVGKANVSHLRRIANLVDEKMRKIGVGNSRLDVTRIAVLAAVNIADDFLRLKEEYEDLLKMLEDEGKKEK